MTPDEVATVLAIADDASATDGVEHLDEATRLELGHRPEAIEAFLIGDNACALISAAQLVVVVRPRARRRGMGESLVAGLSGRRGLRAWSHGDHPAAAVIAARWGWRRQRQLLRLLRPSGMTLIDVNQLRGGPLRVESFRPGDEAELLRVNAAAFSDHPEQGLLGVEGLAERMAEPWFDAADLIAAWDGDRLAGFHWIKRVDGEPDEVYVLAVDPAYAGRGVGRALLEAGLATMGEAQLYVEADNAKARRLYESAGFAIAETHVQYALR